MRSGSGAQFLCVNPAIPHKFEHLSLAGASATTSPAARLAEPRPGRIHRLSQGNQRHSDAHQNDTGPARRAHVFAQNIFRAKSSDHIAQSRRGYHKADRLPGEQHQQSVKRQRHQWHASPKPAVTQSPAEKLQHLLRPEPLRLSRGLHAPSDGDLSSRAAKDEQRKKHADVHHASASRVTAVVRGFVCPTNSTPTQIRTTPTHRRGETASCRNTTAKKVSKAYPNAPAGM